MIERVYDEKGMWAGILDECAEGWVGMATPLRADTDTSLVLLRWVGNFTDRDLAVEAVLRYAGGGLRNEVTITEVDLPH